MYRLLLSLQGISLAEPKSEPPIHFFAVVQQTSAITHLFVKMFDDTIYPLIKYEIMSVLHYCCGAPF